MSAYNYAYSTDGVNWQPWALYTAGTLSGVSYGNGYFLATYLIGAGSGDGGTAISTDGKNWTVYHQSLWLSKPFWVAAWGLWISTLNSNSSGGGEVYTSPDGITWTNRAGGSFSGFFPIKEYGFGMVATATGNTSATGYTPVWEYSSNGTTWTTASNVIDGVVLLGTTNLVNVQLNESSGANYSTDGTTWTSSSVNPGGSVSRGYGVACGTFNGYAFATGFGYTVPSGFAYAYQGSGDVVYTTDGITWNASTTPYGATAGASPSFYFLDYAANGSTEMMMVTAYDNHATVTTNLASWSTVSLPALGPADGSTGYQGITYNTTLGMWLAVSNNPISSGIVMWI